MSLEVQKKLRKMANKKIANHSQSFFKTGKGEYGEGDLFLGIRVPELRKVAKEFFDLDKTSILKLLKSKYHEERLTAVIILVNQYSKSRDDVIRNKLYKLYTANFKYINNWDIVDVSCHKIVGPHLEERSRSILYKWAKSKDLWTRRISIISTFWFIRNNDLDDSYKLATILLKDKHDLMHKAVGWVLRECGKKDFKRLDNFLKSNYKKMPRTMLRYAIEKFPETHRKKYINGTI